MTTDLLRNLFWENPMTLEATRTLRRFLRAGMSGENPQVGKRLNLALLGILGFLYLWVLLLTERTNEDLTQGFLAFEIGLLTLLVPGSLYGAIAVEREKLTYDALIMTRLTPAQIVCGKLWWRIGMILFTMGLFLPLLVLTHFASEGKLEYRWSAMLLAQVQIFTWSLLVGTFSLYVSAKSKKGITALLLIVGAVLLFLLGIPALIGLFGLENGDYNRGVVGLGKFAPLAFATTMLYAVNPFLLTWSLGPHNFNGNNWSLIDFWFRSSIAVWAPVGFFALALLLLRGAIKTLRGLEKPMADNRKRGR